MAENTTLTERLIMLRVGEVETFDGGENPGSIRVAAARLKKRTERIYSTRTDDDGTRVVRLK